MGRVFRRRWGKGAKKRKTEYWSIAYTDQHGRKHSHLATPRTTNRKVAGDLLTTIENEIARGTYRPPASKTGAYSLGEALADYEDARREKIGVEAFARSSDRYHLIKIRKTFDLGRSAESLTKGEVLKFVDQEYGADAALGTRRYPVTLLKAALNRALEREKIHTNPLARPRMPVSRAERRVVWDPDELVKLRPHLPDWCWHVIEISRLTLLRENDVLSLRWDMFRGNHLYPWIQKSRKEGRPRLVTPELFAALPHRGKSPWLFPHPDSWRQHINRDRFTSQFTIARRKAGILGKTFHDIRRTGATALLNAGVPTKVVADLLDHADEAIVSRYAHVLQGTSDAAQLVLAGRPAKTNREAKVAKKR